MLLPIISCLIGFMAGIGVGLTMGHYIIQGLIVTGAIILGVCVWYYLEGRD